jgi:hypothetical protein
MDGRDHEEELFEIIHAGGAEDVGGEDGGAEDGSQFLNESEEGLEIEAQTSMDGDDGSQNVGSAYKPTKFRYYIDALICIYIYIYIYIYILTNVFFF